MLMEKKFIGKILELSKKFKNSLVLLEKTTPKIYLAQNGLEKKQE